MIITDASNDPLGGTMRAKLAGAVLVAILAGCASGDRPPQEGLGADPVSKGPRAIEVVRGFDADPSGRFTGWLAYAMARITGPPSADGHVASPDPAPYEEEAYARESMALVWGELASEERFADRYLSELVAVEAEGFIREYTWVCVLGSLGPEPPSLRVAAFRAWLARKLPTHRVETWASAVRSRGGVVLRLGRQAHDPRRCADE